VQIYRDHTRGKAITAQLFSADWNIPGSQALGILPPLVYDKEHVLYTAQAGIEGGNQWQASNKELAEDIPFTPDFWLRPINDDTRSLDLRLQLPHQVAGFGHLCMVRSSTTHG
jgi:hypothetical protein